MMAGPHDSNNDSQGEAIDGDDLPENGDAMHGDAFDEEALEVSEEYVEDDRLELDEDERLPWLESADYEDDAATSDTGKLVGVILIALLLLALLLGALWWLSNRGPDPDLVADGSTIAAPDGDYKERPDDPGGRTFEGTGDVAPTVGEGGTREGRLAQDGNSGSSGDDNGSSGSNSGSGETSGTASAAGGVGVQVGAYSTRAAAERGWAQLTRQTDALSGFKYRIVQGQADIGTVYRLQAVAGDAGAADALCGKLKGDGVACQVKR